MPFTLGGTGNFCVFRFPSLRRLEIWLGIHICTLKPYELTKVAKFSKLTLDVGPSIALSAINMTAAYLIGQGTAILKSCESCMSSRFPIPSPAFSTM
jgi:hypothetical protein